MRPFLKVKPWPIFRTVFCEVCRRICLKTDCTVTGNRLCPILRITYTSRSLRRTGDLWNISWHVNVLKFQCSLNLKNREIEQDNSITVDDLISVSYYFHNLDMLHFVLYFQCDNCIEQVKEQSINTYSRYTF
jgi:hypothetical protein